MVVRPGRPATRSCLSLPSRAERRPTSESSNCAGLGYEPKTNNRRRARLRSRSIDSGPNTKSVQKAAARARTLRCFSSLHDLNVIQYIADWVAVMYAGQIMEVRPVQQVFKNPLHPYTKGLLAASINFGVANDARSSLEGEVSLPVNPVGCRSSHAALLERNDAKRTNPRFRRKEPANKPLVTKFD